MFKKSIHASFNKVIYVFILTLLFASSLVFDTGGPAGIAFAEDNIISDNLGIGITGLGAKLQLKATGTTAGFTLRVQDSSGADKLIMLDNGNLGIGTTAPAKKLSVAGEIESTVAGTSYFNGNLGVGTTEPAARLDIRGNGTTLGFALRIQNNNAADKIVVLDNGNLGIGTTNPAYKFDVKSDSHFDGYVYMQYNQGYRFSDVSTAGGSSGMYGRGGNDTNDYVSLQTMFNDRLRITSAGNVGIGTSVPQGLLHAGTAPSSGLIVQASGQVGIGTTLPGAALEVNGQVKITGGTPGSGKVLTSSDNFGLATWETPSATGGVSLEGSVNQLLYYKTSGTAAGTSLVVAGPSANALSVGIGTTANAAQLYIRAAGTGTGFALRIADSSTLDKLVVLDKGNVGIGTTNPAATLQIGTTTPAQISAASSLMVSGDLEVDGTAFIGPMEFAEDSGMVPWTDMSISTTPGAGVPEGYSARIDTTDILTVYAQANGSGGIQNAGVGIGTATPLGLLQVGTSPAPGLLVTAAGNLGIGTTNPGTKLEVSTTDTSPDPLIFAFAPNLSGANADVSIGVGKSYSSGNSGFVTWNNNDGVTPFMSIESYAGANPVRISSSQTWLNPAGGNVGIGTTTPQGLLHAGTAASSGLIVQASGQVGIGTTLPGAALEVNGQVKITGGTPGSGKVLTSSDNFGLATWETPSATGGVTLEGSVNQLLYYKTSGTAAGTSLVVAGPSANALSVGIGSTANAAQLYIRGAGTSTGFALRIADSTPTDKLVILDNGNLGIGTTAPGYQLQIRNDVVNSNSALISLISGDYGNSGIYLASTSNQPYGGYILYTNNNSTLNISSPGSTSFFYNAVTELLHLTSTGNVGIGTSVPLARLHLFNTDTAPSETLLIKTAGTTNMFALRIQDSLDADKVVIFDNGNMGIGSTANIYSLHLHKPGGGDVVGLRFSWGDMTNYWDMGRLSGADFSIATDGAGEVFRIKENGNVGIGTDTPLGLLQVGTSPSPGLLVTAGGMVGIGTTDPGVYKLYINGGQIYVDSHINSGGNFYSGNGSMYKKINSQVTDAP